MRALLLVVPLLLLASCGDSPNRLYGSVSQVYPLDFNTVQVTLVGGEVAVEYLRTSGVKTAKVTVTISDIQPVAGQDIDMTKLLPNGQPRGTVQRVDSGGTIDFPLRLGNIHFNQEPVANADITGWFRTTLEDPAGRTLNGNFQAKVQAL